MRIQTPQNKQFTAKLVKEQYSIPKPEWMKIRPPTTDKFVEMKKLLKEKKLNTVCAEARCPNIGECWAPEKGRGTATFMIMGDTCTRACRFCMVKSGKPPQPPDPQEPQNLVDAVKIMDLDYVVITCVTRDDLPDGGAQHWVDCITALKKAHPKLIVELLISDLDGNLEALEKIVTGNPAAAPDVLAHNLETVERLQGTVRDPRANYQKSLKILEHAKKIRQNGSPKPKNDSKSLPGQTFAKPATPPVHATHPAPAPQAGPANEAPARKQQATAGAAFNIRRQRSEEVDAANGLPQTPPIYTKTSLMLGLGETEPEVIQTMKDCRAIGVDVITFGQYLRPSPFHIAIHEYVPPEKFKKYENLAREHGFLYCASGPFVRSSYKAGELFLKNVIRPSS